MKPRLILSEKAEADLEEIAAHIAEESPRAAVQVIAAIRAKCELIALQPLLYPVREDIASGFRRALANPYGLWFQLLPDGSVRIERIVHGARDLPSLLKGGE